MVDEDKTTTTIEVSRENWQKLSGEKWPGESFDNVISRLLDPGIPGGDELEAPAPEPVERREAPQTAESDDGEEIRCEHCGHVWTTKSESQRPTCSQCTRKTDRLPP